MGFPAPKESFQRFCYLRLGSVFRIMNSFGSCLLNSTVWQSRSLGLLSPESYENFLLAFTSTFHIYSYGRSIRSNVSLVETFDFRSVMCITYLNTPPKTAQWLAPLTSLHRPSSSSNANCSPAASRGASSRPHGANREAILSLPPCQC